MTVQDVVIIGGSFAGLSAAMPLVRAQRRVLMIDHNRPRNRFAKASHGIACLDGMSPSEIRSRALAQLQRYPSFELIDDTVSNIDGVAGAFNVATEARKTFASKRLIIAAGITDILPNIPGLEPHWGKSVLHCPYCHGYELRGRELGVLASSEMSFHQAALLPDWGATTLFTQGQFVPDQEIQECLTSRGVSIEVSSVVQVNGDGEGLSSVELEDGRTVRIDGLYITPHVSANLGFLKSFELEMVDSPFGRIVKVNELKESSKKGVFVAGDLSNPMQNGTFAMASGTMAGIAAHRSLVFED